LTPMIALAIAGICNLLLLLFGLRMFCRAFFERNQDAVAFYALLFIVFLWPANTWHWSGFLSFRALSAGNTLPYPSTFAIAMTFCLLSLYRRSPSSTPTQLLCIVLTSVIVLTHPTTAIFALSGLFAITLHKVKAEGKGVVIRGGLSLIATSLLVWLWPYYSFWELVSANNPMFHTVSLDLYSSLVPFAWPVILLCPLAFFCLWSRLKQNSFDALALMLGCVLALYFVGYVTRLYGVGRVVSVAAILIQIVIASRLASWESGMDRGTFKATLCLVPVLVGLTFLNSGNASVLDEALGGFRGERVSHKQFESLADHIEQYDLVLADLKTSWMVPAFAGKVIGWLHPVHWIDDDAQRRTDTSRFFSNKASREERLDIIRRYQPNYLLVNIKRHRNQARFEGLGRSVFESKRFALYELPKAN
jgi:hypothetical protein